MERIDFKDLPDTTTPITADNLNLLQDNIENLFTDIKTWTPTMANANVTYTNNDGYYLKLGRLVFIWFRLQGKINSVNEPKYAFINGLPFECAYQTSGSVFDHWHITDDDSRNVLLRVTSDKLAIQKDDSDAGAVIEKWYASDNTFYLGGSAVYFTNE